MLRMIPARNFILVLFLLCVLAVVGATPALANGAQSGGRTCFGDSATIAAGESVDSFLAFGCNVHIEQGATVRGDVANFGGNLTLAGQVNGNIAMLGGNVSLQPSAVVHGNVAAIGGNVQRAEGATINGGVTNNGGNFAPPVPPDAPDAPVVIGSRSPFGRVFDFGANVLGGIVTALAFAAIGALIVLFAPEPTKRIGDAVQAKPLNAVGVGCLTTLLVPILGLLLVVTLIGIPVAFILSFAAFAAWLLGMVAIGYLTGEKILQAFKARDVLPVVAVILGVIVLTLISQISFIGWFVSFVIGLFGIGAVVLTRFGTRVYPTPPGMMMMPVTAAAGPSAPGTYTPTSSDIATWEDKARQVEKRDVVLPSDQTIVDVPPAGEDIPGA